MRQKELAGHIGISRGSLANIETGRQSMLVHQIYKFASFLRMEPVELLPPQLSDHPRLDRTDLPLPTDLKAQHKKQVADFFMQQVKTNSLSTKEGSHAKSTK